MILRLLAIGIPARPIPPIFPLFLRFSVARAISLLSGVSRIVLFLSPHANPILASYRGALLLLVLLLIVIIPGRSVFCARWGPILDPGISLLVAPIHHIAHICRIFFRGAGVALLV